MLVIGHRGAPSFFPDNTIAGIKKAISLGADAVEIDLQNIGGKPVLSHDEPKARCPSLEEALSAAKGKIRLLLELKDDGLEEYIVRLLEKKKMVSEVTVISFSTQRILKVKKLNKKIRVGKLTFRNFLRAWMRNKDIDVLLPYWAIACPFFINAAHARGKKVYVWTVNNESLMKCFAKRADGIITDLPEKALRLLP
jgi:glycerophosphoryl diester phosphodiesterase